MILRRYGVAYHSVEPDFNAKAMNEVGFRRDGTHSIPTEEFEAGYTRERSHELDKESQGDVQIDAERELLDALRAELATLEEGLPEGSFLVVENETGKDWPRLRCDQRTHVVAGENRLHFSWRVEPPLKVALYTPRG